MNSRQTQTNTLERRRFEMRVAVAVVVAVLSSLLVFHTYALDLLPIDSTSIFNAYLSNLSNFVIGVLFGVMVLFLHFFCDSRSDSGQTAWVLLVASLARFVSQIARRSLRPPAFSR